MNRNHRASVPERILDAALEILGESGIQYLTQVKVAERTGVRQSHLTYYFPTRDRLLEAVTNRGVDHLVAGISGSARNYADANLQEFLQHLSHSITDSAHMRMFIAMIVEADGDATIRQVMTRATERMEAAIAEALGGTHARAQARAVLVTTWGLGLYHFLIEPESRQDPADLCLSWLNEKLGDRRATDADGRSKGQ